MKTSGNVHTPRENDGRYAKHQTCEACCKPIKGEYMSDAETLAVGAHGLLLCDRVRCIAKCDALTIEKRIELYRTNTTPAAQTAAQ